MKVLLVFKDGIEHEVDATDAVFTKGKPGYVMDRLSDGMEVHYIGFTDAEWTAVRILDEDRITKHVSPDAVERIREKSWR